MLAFDITLNFGSHHVSCQMKVPQGEAVGLYGKSGIGKSSILKTIAGLQIPQSAEVSWQGIRWNDTKEKVFVRPQHRPVGLVFQDFALFPHLTVLENITYAQHISEEHLSALIDDLGIQKILKRKPNEISGGQQQRTAIGRALAYDPEVLLLDEPFSALDDHTKFTVRDLLKKHMDENKKAVVIASHDKADLQFFSNEIIDLDAAMRLYPPYSY